MFDKIFNECESRNTNHELRAEVAKPLHALRKEYGSLIAARFGIYAAKEMLRHADITTTAAHYLETKEKPLVELGPSPAGLTARHISSEMENPPATHRARRAGSARYDTYYNVQWYDPRNCAWYDIQKQHPHRRRSGSRLPDGQAVPHGGSNAYRQAAALAPRRD